MLDEGELERLYDAAGDDALLLKVTAWTGMRSAEVRALVWGTWTLTGSE